MRIPQIFIKVSDWFNNESVTNNWLTAVGEGVSTYVNSPAVSAYQQTRQTIPAGIATKIIFDAVDFDLDPRHSYDRTTGVFTPKVAGYYLINSTVGMPSIQTIEVFKNGASFRKYGPNPVGANGFFALSISQVVYLNGTTDYIDIRATQTTAGSVQTDSPYTYAGLPDGATTFFSANLIRPD